MESSTHNCLIWLALCLCGLVVFYLVSAVAGPFLLGLGVAYFFYPLVDKMQAWGVSRGLSSLVLVFLCVLLFAGFLFFFLPFLSFQLQHLLMQLPVYAEALWERFGPYLIQWSQKLRTAHLLNDGDGMVFQAAQTGLSWLAQNALVFASSTQVLFSFFFYALLTPFALFYSLCTWPVMLKVLEGLIPHGVRPAWKKFFFELDQAMAGYIRGQALVCVCMAIYLALGFSLLGLPHGLMLGVLTGLFVFVPYVGMFLGTTVAILLTLVNTPSLSAFLGLAFVLAGGQLLEAFILIPFFIGRRLGVPPVWVLFAIFVSGTLLGMWGVVLALPISIFCVVSLRWLVHFYKTTGFFTAGGAKGAV